MQFNQGTGMFTTDDKEAGHLHRVVIDPKTNEVTHIIMRTGLLLTKDKVVPIGLIAIGRAEGVALQMKTDQIEQLPDFEETHYIAVNEKEFASDAPNASKPISAPALYWYPRYPEMPPIGLAYIEPPYRVETHLNIPEGTVAVKEGAKVLARDGKPVGHVTEILTGPREERVTHLVISRGLLQKEEKLIPIGWVNRLGDDEVELAIASHVVEKLPKYQPANEADEPERTLTR